MSEKLEKAPLRDAVRELREAQENIRDHLDLRLTFAEAMSEKLGLPINEALFEYTDIYRRLYRRLSTDPVVFEKQKSSWLERTADLLRMNRHDERLEWLCTLHDERDQSHGKEYDLPFLPFDCEYLEEEGVVRTHFGDASYKKDGTDQAGPLTKVREKEMLGKLRTMFLFIKERYPNAKTVRGKSWLYNYEAYRRLYPDSYGESRKVVRGSFRGGSRWGQFRRSDGSLNKERAAEFLANLKREDFDISHLEDAFPLQTFAVEAPIEDFYKFPKYGIKTGTTEITMQETAPTESFEDRKGSAERAPEDFESYERELDSAKDIAREAGEIMLHYFHPGTDSGATEKPDGTPLTLADTEINSLVIRRITETFGDQVIGEEESTGEYGMGRRWVCDPICGTKAFIQGVPTAQFSLALVVDGKPVLGILHDPFSNTLLEARRGKGALRNGEILHVSGDTISTGEIVIAVATDDPLYAAAERALAARGAHFGTYDGATHKMRLVATGKLAGCVQFEISAHDMVAAHVIIEEAGGKVTDTEGKPLDYTKPFSRAVYSNGVVHEDLLSAISTRGA